MRKNRSSVKACDPLSPLGVACRARTGTLRWECGWGATQPSQGGAAPNQSVSRAMLMTARRRAPPHNRGRPRGLILPRGPWRCALVRVAGLRRAEAPPAPAVGPISPTTNSLRRQQREQSCRRGWRVVGRRYRHANQELANRRTLDARPPATGRLRDRRCCAWPARSRFRPYLFSDTIGPCQPRSHSDGGGPVPGDRSLGSIG